MPTLRSFGGIAPRVDLALLPDNGAATADNVRLVSGAIEPWRAPVKVADLPRPGIKRTIYRFGQDVLTDAQHWLHWTVDVDVVRSTVAGNERTFFTGDGAPKVTDSVLALTGGGSLPNAAYTLGVPSPTFPALVGVAGAPAAGATQTTRYYVYTFVNAWGEEGGASPVSGAALAGAGQTVNLSSLEIPSGAMGYSTKRIYESGGQADSAGFFLKAEVAAGASTASFAAAGGAVPNPGGADTGIGAPLATANFTPPPENLSALRAMPGGLLLGISGNKVRMSEPEFPYAWPAAYEFPFDHDPVGIGVYSNVAVIATKGRPYVIQGLHPSAMQVTRIEEQAGCASKRSVCEVDGGVVYATASGLVLVGANGVTALTAELYTREQWQALAPHLMFCAYWDRKIFVFHPAGCLVLDPPGKLATSLNLVASAAYVDPLRDALYVAVGSDCLRMDAGAPLASNWSSKVWRLARPAAMRAVRVQASAPVTVKVYGDASVLVHSVLAQPGTVYPLPAARLHTSWQIALEGTARVSEAALVASMDEIRAG